MIKIFSFLVIVVFQISYGFAQSSPVLRDGLYYSGGDNLFTGTAKIESDSRWQEIEAIDGVLHGKISYFDNNGQLTEIGHYVRGQKHGTWIQFGVQGQVLGEAFYKEGKKDGIWTVWDEQGVKRYHMVYSMGRKVDTWKMWDENAVLVSERFYNE